MEADKIAAWISQCKEMRRRSEGSAVLFSGEPNLYLSMKMADRLGHIRAEIEMHVPRKRVEHYHQFWLEFDQSDLPGLIQQGERLLKRFPARHQRPDW